MNIPVNSYTMRTMLAGVGNVENMMYGMAEKHPILVAAILDAHFRDMEESNMELPYMRVFQMVKDYVNNPDKHSRTKIPAIRDLRNAYGLTLADAKGTIDRWVELYQCDRGFVPEYFYSIQREPIRRCDCA